MLALVTADDRDQLKDVRASWKGAVCEGEGDELRILLTSGDELPLGAVTDRGTLPNGNLMFVRTSRSTATSSSTSSRSRTTRSPRSS